ncbi:MAG: hypothetical protein R3301_07935 [Saprospiraceae bacterium]|nr:hypothetical protein [Saprospiraceae bacterium]
MKKFKYSLATAGLLIIVAGAQAQVERSRTVEESWNNIAHVTVDHRHGKLEVIPHAQPQVRLEAVMKVRANAAEDAQIAVDHFDVKMTVQGNRLSLKTQFDTKNWITTMGTTRIKFSDGEKASGIKDIAIDYQLYVPRQTHLDLSNKYQDIVINGDLDGDLAVTQYDADVRAGNVAGSLRANVKYGGATIGQVGDAEIELYDAKMELERAGVTTVKSKYSDYRIGHATSLRIHSYDDDVRITEVTGLLDINDKYSDYNIGSCGTSKIQSYDGDFTMTRTGDHSGMSSYSSYRIGSAGKVTLEKSYDDDFEIDALTSLSCTNSKYSGFQLGNVERAVEIGQSYDDEIRVQGVSGQFNAFSIDSKYTSVAIPLGQLPGYTLDATTKYGKLRYPEPAKSVRHIEKGDNTEVSAVIGSNGAQCKVTISAYDSDIRLN